MRNLQDTFETRKRSFISAFSIGMTVPLNQRSAVKGVQHQLPIFCQNFQTFCCKIEIFEKIK